MGGYFLDTLHLTKHPVNAVSTLMMIVIPTMHYVPGMNFKLFIFLSDFWFNLN